MALRTFRCPNCNEMINTGIEKCRFCSASINHAEAEAAADRMEQINKACNAVNYLKATIAGLALMSVVNAMLDLQDQSINWVFFSAWMTVGAIFVGWWVKYRKVLNDKEADLRQAKRWMSLLTAAWVVMPVVWWALRVKAIRDI